MFNVLETIINCKLCLCSLCICATVECSTSILKLHQDCSSKLRLLLEHIVIQKYQISIFTIQTVIFQFMRLAKAMHRGTYCNILDSFVTYRHFDSMIANFVIQMHFETGKLLPAHCSWEETKYTYPHALVCWNSKRFQVSIIAYLAVHDIT